MPTISQPQTGPQSTPLGQRTGANPLANPLGLAPNRDSPEAPHIVLPNGGCEKLIVYRKSEVVYLGTCAFCSRFLPKHGDRTVDQMVQAARSGKQNILEGSAAAGTSKETEIKLTGVAKASLSELLADYTDYLKSHNLREWPYGEDRQKKLREFCSSRNDWEQYKKLFDTQSDEVLCNMQICLIHQTQRMLTGMLARQEEMFKKYGGIRERMSAVRNAARANDWSLTMYSYLATAHSPAERLRRADEMRSAIARICAKLSRTRG